MDRGMGQTLEGADRGQQAFCDEVPKISTDGLRPGLSQAELHSPTLSGTDGGGDHELCFAPSIASRRERSDASHTLTTSKTMTVE